MHFHMSFQSLVTLLGLSLDVFDFVICSMNNALVGLWTKYSVKDFPPKVFVLIEKGHTNEDFSNLLFSKHFHMSYNINS